jgi:hypothetical protein
VICLPAMLTQQLGNVKRNDIDVTLLGEQSSAKRRDPIDASGPL